MNNIKTVKKTIDVYETTDGKQFSIYSLASAHQNEIDAQVEGILMRDECGDLTTDVRDCYYVELDTDEDIQKFANACRSHGLSVPTCTGNWFYDSADGEWVEVSSIICNLKKFIKE